MAGDEPVHITSFIIRCLPDQLQSVMASAEALPGVEVHGSDPAGRFVALLEGASEHVIMQNVSAIESIQGVINTSMVFHQED